MQAARRCTPVQLAALVSLHLAYRLVVLASGVSLVLVH